MKYTLIFITIFLSYNLSWGQSLCPPNGITTNPDNPTNPQNTAMENDFFDWRIQDFEDYFHPDFLSTDDLFPSVNPYWSHQDYLGYISGLEGDGQETDYSPKEGWELITRNFGRYIPNNPLGTGDDPLGNLDDEFFAPYFLMYNKYTGKMRLLFNIPSVAVTGPFQTVEIHMYFNDITSPDGTGNPKVTALMSNIGNITNGGISQPLDQQTNTKRVIGIANFVNTGWSHVEFDMAYDPCTCMDNSSIAFDFYGVESSDAILTGMLLGTATQADLFSNGAFNDGNRLVNVLKDGPNPQVGSETYKSINEWLEAVKRAKQSSSSLLPSDFVSTIADFGGLFSAISGTIEGFVSLKNVLKVANPATKDKLNKYRKGLKGLGAVAKNSSVLLKEFTNPASKKTFPSIIEAELALSGTVTTTVMEDRATFVIDNPGTSSSTNTHEYGTHLTPSYPYYNEVLGRFALLKTPRVKTFEKYIFPEGIAEASKRRKVINFKLDQSSIEYVFNPALNLDLENTSVFAALVVETQGTGSGFDFGSFEPTHKIDENNFSLMTPLGELNCLGGFVKSYDYRTSVWSPRHYNYKIKLRIYIDYVFNELDRNGNKNRALQILTYPVEMVESTTPLVNELEDVIVGEHTLTGGTLSENVNVIGPVIITGDIFAAAGTEITITGYEILVDPDVIIGPNVFLIPGYPTGCGEVGTSTIDLASYCTNGQYKGNQASALISNPAPSSSLSNSNEEVRKMKLQGKELVTKVYPNPSLDGLFSLAILSVESQNISLKVTDATGREVYKSKNTISEYDEIKIDLSTQPKGFYVIQIIDNLGNGHFEKIIIK